MGEIALLRRTFIAQLLARGLVGAALSFTLIAFFALLTAGEEPPELAAIPGMSDLRVLVQSLQPWELFVAVFLIGAAVDALKRVQTAALDRYNLRRLVALGRTELAAHDDPREGGKLARTRLTGRRRMLEELLSFDPAIITLAAVALALAFIGLGVPALLYAAWALAVPALMPWLVVRMNARRDLIATRTPTPRVWSREERQADLAAFADDRLTVAAQSSMQIVNRPVDRLLVAWPVIALGAVVVAAASIASIVALAGDDGRALLLIITIVVAARSATKLVGSAEQLSFFASVLTHPVGESTDDDEPEAEPDGSAPVT
ncbi:MAG: hypothetical protein Q7J04_00075 [Microcella sp.]|nr:hypothetical protein [Microcella sp.]